MSEDNAGGGKPRPYISRKSSASEHNVGAGLAPALQTSPTLVNLAFQPFLEGLHCLGLELTGQQSEQFLQYQQELLDWNTRVNLTSITNPEEVMIKHFLDSLSLLMAFDAPEARLLDIGAGAGFPGLPLKIVRPQWQLTLLEATGKKVAFLQHLIETLHCTSSAAVHGRAEELAHKGDYRATFDVVTARAVASLPALLEYASPFCRVGGQIILPKKGDLAAELANGVRAARKVGAVLKDDIAVRLPGLNDGRRLLVWEQVRTCPAQFPRSGSVMAKKPLGSFG